MSEYDAVAKELATIIASKTKLKFEQLDPQLNLEESGLDSFARIELVLAIEEHFGFEMSDSEAAGLITVDDLINMVLKLK